MWKRTIQYGHVAARRPVFVGLGHGKIGNRKRRNTYTRIIIICLLYCYRSSRVECECLFSSAFCSLNPFRVHPFWPENRSRCVIPTLADVLKTPHRRVANNILYSTRKIDIKAKQNKRVFKHIYIYIVTGEPLFGSLYPYYFPQVIIL